MWTIFHQAILARKIIGKRLADTGLYPCPSCGFRVFEQPAGSLDLCPVCGWQDDLVQMKYPRLRGASNRSSLSQYQASVLRELPWAVRQIHRYHHDPHWRPLTPQDLGVIEYQPKSRLEYIQHTLHPASYYWKG